MRGNPWLRPALLAVGTLGMATDGGAEIRQGAYVFVGTISGSAPAPRDVSIAVDGQDRLFAVWTSDELGSLDVYGRTYDALGAPVSSVFRVNPIADGVQQAARAAGLPGGGFIVVWDDEPAGDGAVSGIRGVAVAADGTTGDVFDVIDATADLVQEDPAIAVARDDSFVVAWQAASGGFSDFDIVARRFDAAAVPLTGAIDVHQPTAGDQTRPAVAADGDGGFVVAWETSAGAPAAVTARRFAPDGSPLGAELPLDDVFGSGAGGVSAAIDAGGRAVYLWRDPSHVSLRLRRFDAAGDGTFVAGPAVPAAARLVACDQGLAAAPGGRLAVLYDLDLEEGWDRSQLAEASGSDPAVVAGDVMAATSDRCAIAANPRTGRLAWIYAVGGYLQFAVLEAGLPFPGGFEDGGLVGWSATSP